MSRLLVIAAGGTGGHMFPAQALAQEMLRRGWRVALSTDARGARYAAGFPAEVERREVASATFARGGPLAKALVPVRIAAGIAAAVAWVLRARPAAVIGFGGYPSIPALAAGLLTGTPRLIHEQNGVLGRVNRRFAPRVAAVACGTWPLANPPARAALERIGNPVRDAVLSAAATPWEDPGDGPVRLLVTGGSQGASSFRMIPAGVAALPDALRARLHVVHQAREEDREAVAAAYRDAGVAAEVAAFFPDLPARMAAAHLVIARAGASTVAELGVIGRPSVLIPFPAAMDDHQTANARALVDAGAARLCPEPLTPDALSSHIAAALADGAAMAAAARARGAPQAARDLADLVETHARP